jgi:hypothetical protein
MNKKQQINSLLKKIDKGLLESKKWKAKEIAKSILTAIWAVTVFPLILIGFFITDTHKKQ